MEENKKDVQGQGTDFSKGDDGYVKAPTNQSVDNSAENQQVGYQDTIQDGNNRQNVVYDDQWVRPGTEGLAIVGMILGILSLVCCCLTGVNLLFAIVSIVLSAISLKQNRPGKGMAIAGIVCSVIAIIITTISIILTLSGMFYVHGSKSVQSINSSIYK